MNFFAALTQQLSNLLGSDAAGRRGSFFLILLLSIGGLGYLGVRAKDGNFRTLYSNLSFSDAGLAATKLRQLDIPVRFADGGTTLEVPSRHWDNAVMALVQEGFPNSGVLGYELMDKSSIGLSKFEQEVRYHRSLEGELARTIMAFDSIERAKVHLSMPDKSLFFLDEKVGPSASVIVKTRGGRPLSVKEAGGIARLVASAIQGMETDSISIVDSRGLIVDQGGDPSVDSMAVTGRAAFKIDYENRLKDLIETMLAKTVGEGRVVARVNADFDFTQKTEKREIYDPELQVIRQETWTSEGIDSAAALAAVGGVAGSGSNLPNAPQPQSSSLGGGGGGRRARYNRSTTYEVSRTTSVVEKTVPQLMRVTASIFVDGTYTEEEIDGEVVRSYEPRSPTELAIFEEAIKGVIGFVRDRGNGVGDTVDVSSMEFQIQAFDLGDIPSETLLTPALIRDLVQWSIFGVIGLLLIFLVLRPAARGVAVVGVSAASVAALPKGSQARSVSTSGAADRIASPGAASAGALPDETEEDFYDDEEDEEGRLLTPDARQLRKLRKSGEAQAALAEATQANLPKASGIVRGWIEDR